MNSQQLVRELGYSDSPAFLQGERLREYSGYSFLFTQAEQEGRCNLKSIYTLAPPEDSVSNRSLTPVVYVFEADDEATAYKILRRVWHQNVVPFLIVVTPENVRLYSGFEYDPKQTDEERVKKVAEGANEVLSKLSSLKSGSINSDDVWKQQRISVAVFPAQERRDRSWDWFWLSFPVSQQVTDQPVFQASNSCPPIPDSPVRSDRL